jgi:hypothetical protein
MFFGFVCQGTTSVVPPAAENTLGFTGCGKIRFGGRRGFQPPHKASTMIAGFSVNKLRAPHPARGFLREGWETTEAYGCCAVNT